MRIEVLSDATAVAHRAADIVCDTVRAKPTAVFGLPTGQTPIATYDELQRRVRAGQIDFARAAAFAVDEFAGVPSSTAGMNSMFFRTRLRIPFPLHLPEPRAPDLDAEIRAFADGIRSDGGFDLCLLGIGANGHIAFNEPGSPADSRARVVALTEESRRAHAESFGSLDAVPRRGMTLGIADLLDARAILVLATGTAKAAIVARTIEGPTTADVPASCLRSHSNSTWLLDREAAARLSRTDAR